MEEDFSTSSMINILPQIDSYILFSFSFFSPSRSKGELREFYLFSRVINKRYYKRFSRDFNLRSAGRGGGGDGSNEVERRERISGAREGNLVYCQSRIQNSSAPRARLLASFYRLITIVTVLECCAIGATMPMQGCGALLFIQPWQDACPFENKYPSQHRRCEKKKIRKE